MLGEPNVKGYTPLPQSISNTDTEDDDDEHNHHENEQVDCNSKEDNQSRISDTTTICQNGRFYPLDETKNPANRTRNGRSSFAYSNDNIPIMILDGHSHDDFWKRNDMSLFRKLCLIASIMLCILTILIFLYILPCENYSICPPLPQKSSVSWEKTLEDIELHGRITVVPGNPCNLIFLFRNQQFGDVLKKEHMHPEGGGVLSIQGNRDIPLWWVLLNQLPTDINCEIFDADGSGKPDCLISGQGGLLVSIHPLNGTINWNSEIQTYPYLPLLLSDLNSDGINDLISIEVTNSSQNLVFLSGRNGKLLMKHIIPECHSVKLNSIDSSFILSYTCYNSDLNQLIKTILLKKLIESVNSHKLVVSNPLRAVTSTPYRNQISVDTWDLTPHHRLYVRNIGDQICPSADCRVSVNLTLRRASGAGNESRIWDHVSSSSFVTQPAILGTFNQTYSAGFAFKFWSWPAITSNMDKNAHSTIVRQQNLTERVSIVFVNNTEVHAMNASQMELVQLCQNHDCQPNLSRQSQSITIADLNNDGVMELISYRSTYNVSQNVTKASFTSKIEIVKLDSVF